MRTDPLMPQHDIPASPAVPRPRVQFTLRGLMVAVAGVAVLLVLCTSVPGVALLVLFSHVLGIPVLMGLVTVAIRDRAQWAAWCFWVAVAAGNGLVAADCIYLFCTIATTLRAWHKISVSIPSSRGDSVIPLPVECILP
jgi:hypothetical protein